MGVSPTHSSKHMLHVVGYIQYKVSACTFGLPELAHHPSLYCFEELQAGGSADTAGPEDFLHKLMDWVADTSRQDLSAFGRLILMLVQGLASLSGEILFNF